MELKNYFGFEGVLNGNTAEEFLAKISEKFTVEEANAPVGPENKGEFGMFLAEKWYRLTAKPELMGNPDPVKALDVSILQDYLLEPILGIQDPKTDKRIDFVGGIRGLEELIEEKTGINTMTAEQPMTCVAIGTGKYVEFLAGKRDDE